MTEPWRGTASVDVFELERGVSITSQAVGLAAFPHSGALDKLSTQLRPARTLARALSWSAAGAKRPPAIIYFRGVFSNRAVFAPVSWKAVKLKLQVKKGSRFRNGNASVCEALAFC